MPFFRFPFFYNTNYYNSLGSYGINSFAQKNNLNSNIKNTSNLNNNTTLQNPNATYKIKNNLESRKKNNWKSNTDNYFFELFGLKLYFDDVLLICLIFFLYDEGVRDNELFISLILLLLS